MALINLTVGQSTTGSWLSRAIRWVTRSKVSHAWVAYDDETLANRISVGAEEHFVMIPWQRFSTQNKIMAEFSVLIDEEKLREALQWLVREFLWTEYDYGAAASVTLRERFGWLWRKIGKWFKSRFTSSKKLMCSEAVIRLLLKAGVMSVQQLDPEITNAEQLMQLFFSHPNEFKLLYADPEIKKD